MRPVNAVSDRNNEMGRKISGRPGVNALALSHQDVLFKGLGGKYPFGKKRRPWVPVPGELTLAQVTVMSGTPDLSHGPTRQNLPLDGGCCD